MGGGGRDGKLEQGLLGWAGAAWGGAGLEGLWGDDVGSEGRRY